MGIFSSNKMIERIEERQPTFGYVEVRSESGTPLAMATMRNKTRYGALIRADVLRAVPNRVQLWFPADHVNVKASVRWSNSSDFGVKFDEPVECWATAPCRKDRVDVVTTHLERAGI